MDMIKCYKIIAFLHLNDLNLNVTLNAILKGISGSWHGAFKLQIISECTFNNGKYIYTLFCNCMPHSEDDE